MKKELSWKPVNAFVDLRTKINCVNALWAKFNEWELKGPELLIIYDGAEQLLCSQRLYDGKVQVIDSIDTKKGF